MSRDLLGYVVNGDEATAPQRFAQAWRQARAGGLDMSLFPSPDEMPDMERLRAAYASMGGSIAAPDPMANVQKVGDRLVRVGQGGVQEIYAAPQGPSEQWLDLSPDEIAERGLKPGVYQRSSTTGQLRSTGTGGTTVNVGGKEQTEFDKTTGKQFAERYVAMNDNAIKALGNLASLAAMEQAISNPAVYTGAGGESIQGLRQIGVAFGADPAEINAVADGEVVQSVSRQLALMLRDPSSGAGMPGAMSDSDRAFLVSMVPGLAMSPEGNRRLIEVAKRVAQRQIQIAEMANAYVNGNGTLDGGFQRHLAQFAASNPMFTMEDYSTAVRGMSDDELRRVAGE